MEQYVNAMYFATTTMCTIGYGDIYPMTSIERIVVIIMELNAGMIFAYIISKIGSLFTNYNLSADSYK